MAFHRHFCAPIYRLFLLAALAFSAANIGSAQIKNVKAPSKAKCPSQLESLAKVIRTAIAPDSWDEVGGAGSISTIDNLGVLVVSQTDGVHEKIGNLIRVLRKVRRETPDADSQPGQAESKSKSESIVVENDVDRTAHQKIHAALNAQTSLEFFDAPLREVVDHIRSKHKIPLYVDGKSLEEVGLGSDTPVTASLKGISLRSGLRLVLGKLGLTYVVKDEVLKLTTPEQAESELITRVYPLRDLVPAKPKSGEKKQ